MLKTGFRIGVTMNIFDILGPVMVGPSSSHTAGAVRIGAMTRKLLDSDVTEALIYLHGSFADTGVGHGTDCAIVAGLLGMEPDDMRIPHSLQIAKEQGVSIKFNHINLRGAHPNTAIVCGKSVEGKEIKVLASSLGGGRIMVNEIDDVEVNFTGEHPTLIVHNQDKPGYVAQVTGMLSKNEVNIATMQLCRDKRGGRAVMILETDQNVNESVIDNLKELDGIVRVTYIDPSSKRN